MLPYISINISIRPIYGAQKVIYAPDLSGPDNNANEGNLPIPQILRLEPHDQMKFYVIPRTLIAI